MTHNKIEWFSGSGGPLLLLPEDLVEHWSGIDPPAAGRVVEAKERWNAEGPATDFDRACDVEELIANIEVGSAHGIVLGAGPYPTMFRRQDSGGLLVRWVQGDNERTILDHLSRCDMDADSGIPAFIDAHPGPLILFDAACPGHEVQDDKLAIPLHPGRYVAGAVEYSPDDDIELVVVQLTKVD